MLNTANSLLKSVQEGLGTQSSTIRAIHLFISHSYPDPLSCKAFCLSIKRHASSHLDKALSNRIFGLPITIFHFTVGFWKKKICVYSLGRFRERIICVCHHVIQICIHISKSRSGFESGEEHRDLELGLMAFSKKGYLDNFGQVEKINYYFGTWYLEGLCFKCN